MFSIKHSRYSLLQRLVSYLAELQHLQADVSGADEPKGPGLRGSLSDVGRSEGRPSAASELGVTMAASTWEII